MRNPLHFWSCSHQLSRLKNDNKRLECELAELRAITSPTTFTRSPPLRSPPLPTVSPSSFSARSTGEREMDISSTPLRPLPLLPETGPPFPNDSSISAEPPEDGAVLSNSQEDRMTDRPSSAPPNIQDDAHRSVLLSPFQLSASLHPRSKST